VASGSVVLKLAAQVVGPVEALFVRMAGVAFVFDPGGPLVVGGPPTPVPPHGAFQISGLIRTRHRTSL